MPKQTAVAYTWVLNCLSTKEHKSCNHQQKTQNSDSHEEKQKEMAPKHRSRPIEAHV